MMTDDDFWNDCYKTPAINTKAKSKAAKPEIKINNEYIKKIIQEEEARPNKVNSREEKSVEHCIALYNRPLANRELQRQIATKERNRSQSSEISQCTFKPQTTTNKQIDKKLKDYHNTKIYSRGIKYQQKHLQNITKLYQDKNEDNSYRCTFKPDIKYANLTEVFCDNSNKISTENDSNKLFIYRYMKAREEEEYKKNRLLGDLSRNAKLNWEKKRIKRSISQKDSICIRQTLHNELLTAQNDNNDNDTE